VIFSSADIAKIIGGDPVIRALARVKIIDGRPPLEPSNEVVIYISRYPVATEFQATWTLWIVDVNGEPLDLVTAQLRKLLPGFAVSEQGIIIKATVTELKSNKTETKPVKKDRPEQSLLSMLQDKFDELKQSIDDKLLLVGPGRAGRDGSPGKDGAPGRDGRDGKDLVATDTEIGDLKDVHVSGAEKGQFLMFDGASWVARFVPQLIRASGGGGGSGTGGGIEEAPLDGKYYVRQNGQWVSLVDALTGLVEIDAGDFTLGVAETNNSNELNGGDFSP
jgi:hypothetical protein